MDVADPSLEKILIELGRREPIFHRPEHGTTRADFEKMTEKEFWQIGASGKRYSRELVLEILEERYANPQPETLDASDFRCQRLGEDLYLLTYNLVQEKVRKTRRSTIWRHTEDGWKIVFHQGTIIQD